MSILYWPLPTTEEMAMIIIHGEDGPLLAQPRIFPAIRAYLKRARVTLDNGVIVGPNLRVAKSAIKAAMILPGLPVAVTHGHWVVRDPVVEAGREAARVAANALRMERFRHFCKEDGIIDGKVAMTDQCDSCKVKGEGTMHYQPDAMGYPTPVYFGCNTCSD